MKWSRDSVTLPECDISCQTLVHTLRLVCLVLLYYNNLLALFNARFLESFMIIKFTYVSSLQITVIQKNLSVRLVFEVLPTSLPNTNSESLIVFDFKLQVCPHRSGQIRLAGQICLLFIFV